MLAYLGNRGALNLGGEPYRTEPENERKENSFGGTGILKAGGPIEIECFDFHRTLSGKI